ncbi:MAG: fimbrillin family protein [Bacteroidaceae bacterium]|nr:fimbrillin family protein [Bacteroidaceae bacterium]
MKKTFITMLALVAGAMVFTACSSDEFENNNETPSVLKPMTFYASMEEQGGATRATINGTFIKWENDDKIAIFDGVEGADHNFAHEFTLTGGAGSTSGTFEGTAAKNAEVYYALYPNVVSKSESKIPTRADAEAAAGDYGSHLMMWEDFIRDDEEMVIEEMEMYGISEQNQAIILAYLKDESVTIKTGVQQDGDKFEDVVLPAEQIATPGSADPKAMLMIAKSTDASTLQFKNICAYVKVTPQFDCYAICLRSTDATKYLAGTVTVDYKEGAPTTTVTANGTNEVFLTSTTGTITADNDYYIAVRPEALSSGFTIEFLTADKSHYYARTSSKELGLVRSYVTNLGEFTTSGKWSINTLTSGTADGHDWRLVSPTLKIATSPTGEKYQLSQVAGNLSLWGSNWALLTYDDCKPLSDAKAISSSNVSGIGVLKFITFTMNKDEWPSKNFWLGTMDGTSRYNYNIILGQIKSVSKSFDIPSYAYMILYKYIGK